ncbi:hypothetical protein D3C87_2017910 [compost metagenome]
MSVLIGVESVAGCQSPSSMRTSTPWMPTDCAHATPAIGMRPAATGLPILGVSILDENLIGASAL